MDSLRSPLTPDVRRFPVITQYLNFRGWRLSVDPEATSKAYAAARPCGPEDCGCRDCRNFIAARHQAYPPELKTLARVAGVEPLTETEIWELGPVRPGVSSPRQYGGFFHFVGAILQDPGTKADDIYFLSRRDLLPASFADQPVVQVEFCFEVPWVLDEPSGE